MKLLNTQSTELNYVRALVYGETGVGKTTSLLTLNEKTAFIVCGERGTIPLRAKEFRAVAITSWDDTKAVYRWFKNPDGIEDDDIRQAVQATKVLAIDSLSIISELCAKQIITVDRKQLIHNRTKASEPLRDSPKEIYAESLTMEDYGLYYKRMMAFIGALCHLPVHVIMTCLAGWSEDKNTGITHRTPNLLGKSARECPQHFGFVFHMESLTDDDGNNARAWRTFNDGNVIAKDESGALEPFEEPDWGKLVKKVFNGTHGKATNRKAKAK